MRLLVVLKRKNMYVKRTTLDINQVIQKLFFEKKMHKVLHIQ
jgi:hypothetical protein